MSDAVPQEIRGVLIPLQGEQLLLPNAAVAEVIDYREPDAVDAAPAWVLGTTAWRQRNLTVVRLEKLLGLQTEGDSPRQRIVICHTLDSDARRPFIGIVAAAIPRLVRLREEGLTGGDLGAELSNAPVHARVSVDDQVALIPDLTAIEGLLAEVA